jgi:ketosteroid isomerase-like protein
MSMAQVEVWLENTEVIQWGRRNEKGEIVLDLFPAQQELIGRCEATPEAVAALAGVGIAIAAEALSHSGEPVFIRRQPVPPLYVDLYLVVYPYQKRTKKRK